MAHPCIICGSECYCHGDIDDCIVSKTPSNCRSCGCEEDDEGDYDDGNDFECCSICDNPDACSDFGCASEMGLKINVTDENIGEFISSPQKFNR